MMKKLQLEQSSSWARDGFEKRLSSTPGLKRPVSWLSSKHTAPADSLRRAAGHSKCFQRETPRQVLGSCYRPGLAVSGCRCCVFCMWPRAMPTSRPVCTVLHAASLAALAQMLASTKSSFLSYLLLQSLPPFIECQPKSALLPSQPPL